VFSGSKKHEKQQFLGFFGAKKLVFGQFLMKKQVFFGILGLKTIYFGVFWAILSDF
jgi:hypothetical protein